MRFDDWTKMVKPIKVREMEFPVYVSDYGSFVGVISEDDWVEAPTLNGLKEQMDQVIQKRAKQIAIPFCVMNHTKGFRNGTVRGIHAGNGGFVVTWEDGLKETVSKLGTFCEPISPEMEKQIMDLANQMNVLQDKRKELSKNLVVIPGEKMAELVRAALGNCANWPR